MKKLMTICVILFSVLSAEIWAQENRVLQGYIKDKETGEALPGATVIEVDAEERHIHGVVTDINGFYMIKIVEPNSKLKISFVGYKTQTINIGGRSQLNLELEDDSQQLETVVVQEERYTSDGFIAMRDKVSAVAQINLDDLDEMGVASVDEMLQGQISNVDITALSGDPGAGMQIRIRGTATITGDREPLIILDGMPYDVEIDNTFDFNSADTRDYGSLLSIAPDDIQKIEVLKDAASAAIWGAKAANGVIEITTKRGRKSKPKLRYNFKAFRSEQPDPVPLLNGGDYVTLQKQAFFNQKGQSEDSDILELNYDQDWDLYHNYAQDTDWLDEITQAGQSQEHNLSITGGGDKARYRVGVGLFDQEGTTVGTALERLSFRANMDFNVSTRLMISSDFSYTRSENERTYYGDERSVARLKMPNQSVYEYDSLGNKSGRYFLDPRTNAFQAKYKSGDKDKAMYNPVAVINEGRNSYLENKLRSTFRLRYNITEYLMLQSSITFDLVNGRTKKFLPIEASSDFWNSSATNKSSEGNAEVFRSQTLTKLIYTPNLGDDHSVTVMGQWQTSDSRSASYAASAGGLPSGSFDDPGLGSALSDLSSENGLGRSMGGLIRAHYKWKDRYMINAGIRADASSKFGDDTKWGNFPFGGVAWRASEESFLRDKTWLNELKIRGSFGVNGRSPSGMGHFSIYKTGGSYIDQGTVYPDNVKLKNLKWERVTQANLGFELAAYDNRFNAEFDVYEKVSTDLLWDLNVPTSSGFSKYKMNAGGMTNRGIELALRAVPIQTKDWRLDLQFNISRNENRVDEVPDNFSLTKGNMRENGNYATKVTEGNPIGGFYGYVYKGVYSVDSEAIVYDKNGEQVIDPITGYPLRMLMSGSNYRFREGDASYADLDYDGEIGENDVAYLGSSNPKYTGGFGFRIRYKGLSLSSNFHFRQGQDIVNIARMKTENMYTKNNQSTATMNRWRFPGDQTDIPRAVHGMAYNWLGSDRFVEDGSFVRWKNLSVNYRFAKELIKKFNLSDLSVFATAYNLYTFTEYTGQDPEVPLGADPYFFGKDTSTTPPSRTYTLGMTVIF
ncbi:SusC/RagA family TonB-linked outer membrane protein [Fulvitalea axinellae]|uniref:SusC/RagA family TonB-linked outer membrane protein n=1 Tax=Fulvitalea axinellae TaxID=1182444 RepID=A0AAU9DAR0_9BACT|nr:SusC/RagA family TonB-linked outer membrane protein [Fulvitalea axinellae]